MRKSLLLSLLACLVLCSAGCVVVVKDEERLPPDRADCHFIEEIDAVSKLNFDSDRRDAYVRIARRECVCDETQVYLVDQALTKLSFEQSMETVLVALIHSPSFSCDARNAIFSQLDRLKFDSTRSRILKELDQHDDCF